MPTGASSLFPFDDAADDESRLVYPIPLLTFPTIEQTALATRRTDATEIAVAIGLGAQTLQLCMGAMGEVATIVVTHDGSAATDLLIVLRPRLVISAASLASSDVARLVAAAAACGAQLVRIEPGASDALIDWLVRRAASLAFARAPMPGDVQRLVRAPGVLP